MTGIHSVPHENVRKHDGALPGRFAHLVADDGSLGLIMELSGKLQTTLDLESLIELFAQVILEQFEYDSLKYRKANENLHVKLGGRSGKNKLRYDLKILDSDLGVITFTRNRKFRDNEIEQIEDLLAALLYPLRNALLYRAAIHSAFIDSLTGVKNRTAFDSNFCREIDYSRRKQSELSLIVLDIDLFKGINDKYGHIVGDAVLRQVAQSVEKTIRSSDALYRYGGEEFAIVLNGTDSEGAKLLAERIRQNVAALKIETLDSIRITLSLGVAMLQENDDPSGLFARADAALYRAKRGGRNQVVCAD
jgi:diguanylate cyclase (GGDEF)-like protein